MKEILYSYTQNICVLGLFVTRMTQDFVVFGWLPDTI